MSQFFKVRPGRALFLLFSFAAMIMLLQGCATTYNNSNNWHRTPPSTGRSKCGCMLMPPMNVFSNANNACEKA